MPLVSAYRRCFAQFRFLPLLLVTAGAAWNIWHSTSKSSSFSHFYLTLLNALGGGVGVGKRQKPEINLPRVTKQPSCTLLKQKSPHPHVSASLPLSWGLIYKCLWSGSFFPRGRIPTLGTPAQSTAMGAVSQALPHELASVPAKSIVVCAQTESVSVQTQSWQQWLNAALQSQKVFACYWTLSKLK